MWKAIGGFLKGVGKALLPGLFSSAGSVAANTISNEGMLKAQELANKHNVEYWNMQNEYNHPLAQMQRLKDAGLNPNMIYGTSPSSAVGNAGSQVAPAKAPGYNIDNPVPAFFDTQVKQAQTSNIEADALLKAAQAMKVGKDANLTQRQTELLNDQFDSLVKLKREESLQAELQTTNLSYGVKQAAINLQSALLDYDMKKAELIIKQLDSQFAKDGIRPQDTIYIRLFSAITGLQFNNAKDINKWYKELFK